MHPRPPVLEEELPSYELALTTLPEEPSPVTLPALKPTRVDDDEMDAEGGEDEHPPEQGHQQTGTPIPGTASVKGANVSHQAPQGSTLYTVLHTKTYVSRTEALSAFIRVPFLEEPTNLFLGDITILLHLLFNSP